MTSAQPQAAETQKPTFDVAAYVAIVRRRWKFVVAVTVIGFAAAWFLAPKAAPRVTVSGPPSYKATNTMLQLGDSSKLSLDRVKFLALLGEVPRRVAERIGYGEDPSLLASEIEINIDPQVGAISFTTTQSTPEIAQQLADAWASETLTYVSTVQADAMRTQVQDMRNLIEQLNTQLAAPEVPFRQTLTARRDSLVQQVASLEQQLNGQAGAAAAPGLLTVEPAVAQAIPPDTPKMSPTGKIGRPIWLAGITFMALVLGIAGAIILDRLDKRLHTREDVEDAYDETILAEVPTRGHGVTVMEPQSAPAEAMRMLRTALLASAIGAKRQVRLENGHLTSATDANVPDMVEVRKQRPQGRSVLVTSSLPGEGKTNTALNLAMVFTEQQMRVLLVDADLRKPDVSDYFGMGSAPGISDLAAGNQADAHAIAATCRATDNPYLFLLPAGTMRERPALLLRGVREVIEEARTIVDVVIVDSTALLVANDSRELLSAVDGVLLAVALGVSTTPAAEQTRELFDRLSPPVLGIALLGSGGGDARTFRKMQNRTRSTEAAPGAHADAPAAPAAPVGPDPYPSGSHDHAGVPAQVPGHGS
ncbi:MAG: hypothetical protein K1X95_08065 [Acidimicrobiia bacterium]|nr:hypothetical protein [Acidimicrobiia bacterium]